MYNKYKTQILAFFTLFSSSMFASKVIDMAKLGVTTSTDATEIVLEALKQANYKDAKLVFPKGTYHFYKEKAVGKYHSVTNHDNSYKYFAFPLIDCSNIEIDGQGSEFIFHEVITPFLLENSKNITIKNISIDWNEPFYLQGKVLESDAKNHIIDIEMYPFNKNYNLEGNQISFTANGHYFDGLGENMIFNPETNAVAYKAQTLQLISKKDKTPVVESIGENKCRIAGRFMKSPADKGLIYVFKGPNGTNRLAPAVHLTQSENVKMENVNIYHAGGMGIIGERTKNIHLDNVNVKLREGSDRIVTTTADATHFCNCAGDLIIENCLFENMLDDASNIHGTYVKISKIVDQYTVQAGVKHYQQYDYVFAGKGDKIEFITFETLLPISSNTVSSVKVINEKLVEYRFENPIPKELKVNDALDNITWYPVTTFKNNIVRNNRARSILISTRNKTIVEGNSFSSMMSSILFEGDLNHWHESGAVDDVVIRNNTFGDNVYGSANGSVIWINPRMQNTVSDKPYEKNIRIENNIFKTFDNSILDAKSVDGLIFNNNTIIQSKTYVPFNPNAPQIKVSECINTTIKGNIYKGDKKATISIDKNSENGLKIDKKQKGFE